jgi:hypothetical protein
MGAEGHSCEDATDAESRGACSLPVASSAHHKGKEPVVEFLNNLWGLGFRNLVGIGVSYRPARLHRLAEMIPWNRFLGSSKVKKFGLMLHMLAEFFPWNRFLGSLQV